MIRKILIYGLLFLPLVVWSQDFISQFPHHKRTEYFDFYYLRESPKISETARFADGFVKLLNRDFFKADFDYPIRVLVLEDRAQFQQFLIRQLHLADPPNFGVYLGRYKLFATHEGSGLGTFAHEILHPLVEQNLAARPPWALEGIPTFFEKFYGCWKADKLVLYWGYQNPWRIQQIGSRLAQLDLKTVIADPKETGASSVVERRESDWRMASVFLWQQGRFKRFLDLIARHDKAGYPTYFEAAMDMPIERILPLWQGYLNEVAAQRAKLLLLPPSQVFADQSAFEDFVKTNNISLDQPAKRD